MIYFAYCVTPAVKEGHLGMLMQLQTALSVYLSICGNGTMRLSEVILSYRELRDGSLFMRVTGSGKNNSFPLSF